MIDEFPVTLMLIAGLGLLAGLGAIAAAIRLSSWRQRLPLGLLALICLTPGVWLVMWRYPELVDARFGTFKALYADIQPGMTRAEVLDRVALHYPEAGPRVAPRRFQDEADALGFFMDAEGRRGPNCEGILLDLHDGRVTRKRYSVD